jgi:hypothetical protein
MAYLGVGEERDPLAGIKALLGGVVPEQWPGREGPTVLPTGGGGMVPSPVNPEAIRTFTEKVNPPGQLTGNIGNLPPGDFLRMLYNPDVTAPAAPTPTGPVAAHAVSPADAAAKMAGQYSGSPNLMPWDFWMKNPGVSGGMMRVNEGPKAGQTFSFFDQNKPADMMDTIRPLIQQYADRASILLTNPSSNPLYDAKVMDTFMRNINSLIGTSQAGAIVPSTIAKNTAEAGRPQVAQGWSGPGEMSTMLIPPGGQPSTIATGGPESKASLAGSTLMSKLIPTLAQEALKASFDTTQMPEGRAEAQRVLNGLLGMAGTQDLGTQATTSKPSRAQWLASAKKANPGRSDQELLSYYQQKYGR